jgi:hypothetical protein
MIEFRLLFYHGELKLKNLNIFYEDHISASYNTYSISYIVYLDKVVGSEVYYSVKNK